MNKKACIFLNGRTTTVALRAVGVVIPGRIPDDTTSEKEITEWEVDTH